MTTLNIDRAAVFLPADPTPDPYVTRPSPMATEAPELTPRVTETLRLVRELRNPNRAELASKLGCSPSTAAQYTAELRSAGLIYPSSSGRFARWRCTDDQPTPAHPPRPDAPYPPALLTQAPSIWGYARRCAVHYANELSAALGWPGGISSPILDRQALLRRVAQMATQLCASEPEDSNTSSATPYDRQRAAG
jgi:DNA-binding transcriptional MocR family regulator